MADWNVELGRRSSVPSKAVPKSAAYDASDPRGVAGLRTQTGLKQGQTIRRVPEGEARSRWGIVWPFVGQALAAFLGALVSLLVFWLMPSGEAAAFFAAAALASFLSTVGALGQRKGLTRDLSVALATGFGLRSLVWSRLKLVGAASVLLAVGAAFATRWVVPDSQRSLLIVAAVVAWVGADSFRGTLADAQISLGNDRRAMLLGDGARWTVVATGIIGYFALGGRRADVLVAVAAGGSVLFSFVAGFLLKQDVSNLDAGPRKRHLTVDPKSVAVLTATDVSGALASQLTIVFVAISYASTDVSAFSLAMRVAAGLAIVQAGTLKYVLPNAVGVDRLRASGAERSVQVATGIGTAVAVVGAVVAVGFFLLVRDEPLLAVLTALLAVGVIGNIASGPNEPILVANGRERAALASNFVFGAIAAIMPLAYFAGWPITVVAGGVAVAVLGHNGTMAGASRWYLGAAVGFWWLPVGRLAPVSRDKIVH